MKVCDQSAFKTILHHNIVVVEALVVAVTSNEAAVVFHVVVPGEAEAEIFNFHRRKSNALTLNSPDRTTINGNSYHALPILVCKFF